MGIHGLHQISRPSEIFLSTVAVIKSLVFDTGTGLRMIKYKITKKMEMSNKCSCGTFVQEAKSFGADVGANSIELQKIEKPQKIAWEHIHQFLHLLKTLLIFKRKINDKKII